MATGVGLVKMRIDSIRWPISKNFPVSAKITQKKICDASRDIANFVSNFVYMAKKVGRLKMQLAAFVGSSPKTPFIGAKISQKSISRAEL